MNQTITCAQLVASGMAYPHAREKGSYLFAEGVSYLYESMDGDLLKDAVVQVAPGQTQSAGSLIESLDPGVQWSSMAGRVPVIAYGSNATVDGLTRKFVAAVSYSGSAVLPVTKAIARDVDVTWLPSIRFTGGMPATLASSPGTSVEVWITWLDDDQLKRMNDSEDVGAEYSVGTLPQGALTSEVPLAQDPMVYVGCGGTFTSKEGPLAVKSIPATDRQFKAMDQSEAMGVAGAYFGWKGNSFGLMLKNVQDTANAKALFQSIAAHANRDPIPGYTVESACASSGGFVDHSSS